jgi:hypothetical protein
MLVERLYYGWRSKRVTLVKEFDHSRRQFIPTSEEPGVAEFIYSKIRPVTENLICPGCTLLTL